MWKDHQNICQNKLNLFVFLNKLRLLRQTLRVNILVCLLIQVGKLFRKQYKLQIIKQSYLEHITQDRQIRMGRQDLVGFKTGCRLLQMDSTRKIVLVSEVML